jgi:hypothetical protein
MRLLDGFGWWSGAGLPEDCADKGRRRSEDVRFAREIQAELHLLKPCAGVIERQQRPAVFMPMRSAGGRELFWCHGNPSFEVGVAAF